MVNKKAQDLSIGTLILIVLGIVVLVLLILGFSIGWSNLWEKIGIFGGSSSIGDIVTACNLAVTTGDSYGFFQGFKQIKVDGKTEYLNCQDTRVAANIDSPLTNFPAEHDTAAISRRTQCIKLAKAGNLDPTTKVNNAICPTGLTCKDLGGQSVAEGDACETSPNLNKIKNTLTSGTTKEFCCVP